MRYKASDFEEKIKVEDLGSCAKTVSRYIYGYKTVRGEPRYQVILKTVHYGTFYSFEEARIFRDNLLEDLE
jgi:hypothetical protein